MRKLHVDFLLHLSADWGMINFDEIDPRKARSGLFALVTERLEDAHELAVHGQNSDLERNEVLFVLGEITDQANQIESLLMAIGAIQE